MKYLIDSNNFLKNSKANYKYNVYYKIMPIINLLCLMFMYNPESTIYNLHYKIKQIIRLINYLLFIILLIYFIIFDIIYII